MTGADSVKLCFEEKKYFRSAEYRDVLQSHMLRTPDTLHRV